MPLKTLAGYLAALAPASLGEGEPPLAVGEPLRGAPLFLPKSVTFPQAVNLFLRLCKKKKLCKAFGLPLEPYCCKGLQKALTTNLRSFDYKNTVTFDVFSYKNTVIDYSIFLS